MELGLEGKTVIITGGGANIGRGIVFGFAREKANIVIADIDEEQARKVAKEAEGMGGKLVAMKTDVTDYDSVDATVKQTIQQFGKVDVLVNNAGYVANKLFIKKPRDEYEKEIKINYLGVINCTRAVLDNMIERKAGKIVNIASDSGRVGEPREAVYSGTKGAVIAFGKAVAKETGRFGITVNAICPGATIPEKPGTAGKGSMWAGDITVEMIPPETKERIVSQYPLGRMGKPEDVANAAVFLASDAANFITGQTLSVSGGFSMV
ncbi:MAG: glucose 1-dehydrogenase [Dehalococcoidia bacterium]|nr:glucose 1-dehydrogenase [Dehalococcoidia bacterium]